MKMIYGKGINDIKRGGVSYIDSAGKRKIKRFYTVWSNMLLRCYNKSVKDKYRTYCNTTVCDDWLTLSIFKRWFDDNYIDGWHLDKDLLNEKARCYSPENCRFVPRSLNNLFTNRGNDRGPYLLGVSYSKEHKKFRSSLNFGNGNQCHIGYFETEKKAHKKYIQKKVEFVLFSLEEYRKTKVCRQLLDAIKKDPISRIMRNNHE